MSTWVALAVLMVSLGWLFWKHVITPWYPLEGMGKVAFVAGCWWGGGWMTYYGLTHQLFYWGVSLLIGCGLLAWGCLLAYGPFLRWRKDQVMFGKAAPSVRWLEPEREKDRAA